MLHLLSPNFDQLEETPLTVIAATQKVDEEICEDHFFAPVPKAACTQCMGHASPKRADTKYHLERVIIEPRHQPTTPVWMWTPQLQKLNSIPAESDFVHITGSFSAEQFDLMCERLPRLVLVEVVPSSARFVERNLSWFSAYHVGISAVRRYRQS